MKFQAFLRLFKTFYKHPAVEGGQNWTNMVPIKSKKENKVTGQNNPATGTKVNEEKVETEIIHISRVSLNTALVSLILVSV